jgi:sphinganine-1-phosphate aldolase
VVGAARVVAKDKVASEERKIKDKTIAKVMGKVEGPRFKSIPEKGLPKSELLALLERSSAVETKWREGKISGTVYHSGAELAEVISSAFKAFASSNPIHPDVFPTCRKMEAGRSPSIHLTLRRCTPHPHAFHPPAEVVAMCCSLFGGDADSAGTMTSGGTESIIMAVKTHRDYGPPTHTTPLPSDCSGQSTKRHVHRCREYSSINSCSLNAQSKKPAAKTCRRNM